MAKVELLERHKVRKCLSGWVMRAKGRNGGRSRVMTADKLRYGQHLMARRPRPAAERQVGMLEHLLQPCVYGSGLAAAD